MRIIYISSVCSQKKFDNEVSKIKNAFAFQNQKFHHLLLDGLSVIENVEIKVISTYPVDRSQKYTTYEEEIENGIKYIYPSYFNVPILHRYGRYINTKKAIKRILKEDSIIVCNVLDYDQCLAAQSIKKSYPNIKIVGIVTDLPNYTSGATFTKSSYLKTKLSTLLYGKYKRSIFNYDAYLFLAEPMNDVVNINNRPYCIIEGFSDINMLNVENVLDLKYNPKVLLYTGGIHKEYGIKRLVEAFDSAKIPGWELHVYGNGNYKDELINVCKNNPSIKYYGVKRNEDIIIEQLKASILINPRPTNEEYVKYSFPSKTMEYMASGTPLLTTCLPSMPSEYYPFVYLIENELHEGFINTLFHYLSKNSDELHKFGLKAKEFILKNKNNIIQADKFYNFLLSTLFK